MTHTRIALIPLFAAACTLTAIAQNTPAPQQESAAIEAKQNAEAQSLMLEQKNSLQSDEPGEQLSKMQRDEAFELISVDGKLVRNKPYSADSETDIVQTLGDGNRIQHHTVSKFYRDSQGRTRREQTFGNVDPSNSSPHEVKIFIDDPVSNAAYVLDPGSKTALRLKRSRKFLDEREAESRPAVHNLPKPNEGVAVVTPDGVTQDLGKKTIEGVECEGTQQTITIPASQIGNERPIVIVTETWFAPSIAAVVQSTTSDPRFGQTTYQLHNLQLNEPPSQLFESPADYRVETSRP
jgi:hypothetical protein